MLDRIVGKSLAFVAVCVLVLFMNSFAPSDRLETDTKTAQGGEDAAYYRQVLHGLIDAGADLARLVHQQVVAQVEAAPTEAVGADVGVTFERIARTVRRCILLAQRLDEPAAGSQRVAARRRIIRAVEDAIERDARGDAAESLHAEFLERLDAPDIEDDIVDRPVAEIIADICRDLGLAALPGVQPWKRRSPADVAALCARAAMLPERSGAGDRTWTLVDGVRRFGGP
jgi:hypothetical protein